MINVDFRTGDALILLKEMPSESIQCCVTSPPYYGLRKYGDSSSELGQETTPELFIANLVAVFEEVRRVLKTDGVLWVNMGDSYFNYRPGATAQSRQSLAKDDGAVVESSSKRVPRLEGYKEKDLMGIPWMLAFALRSAGWYLRCDIIWAKANCMPESVEDRPTRSHEFIFLLSKSPRYYYDHEAIKEPCIWDVDGTGTASRKARASKELKSMPNQEHSGIRPSKLTGGAYSPPGQAPHGNARKGGFKYSSKFEGKNGREEKQRGHSRRHNGFDDRWDKMMTEEQCTGMRNKRDVWTVAPAQYRDAHFATFPADLIRPCILAGSKAGDTILDPFGGSGTVGEVALEYGRNAILLDLYEKHRKMQEVRCNVTAGLAL